MTGGQSPGGPADPEVKELPVFLCYRRQDGSEHAAWIDRALDGHEYRAKDGTPRRVQVYYDKVAPSTSDWKQFHFPRLQSSAVLIFISTPGAAIDLGDKASPDWVQEELKWWVAHRGEAPVVVDTTGDPRWIPPLVRKRWKDLNRIPVDLQRVDERNKGTYEPRVADEVMRQLVNTFLDKEEPTVFEDVERERALTRKRTVALVVASILATIAILFAGLAAIERRRALAETRAATSLRLATEAEHTQRYDLALLLAAQSYALDGRSVKAREALLHTLLAVPRLRGFLDGRQGRVWGLAWSGDGRRLVASSDDGGLVMWDLEAETASIRLAGDHADDSEDAAIWAVDLRPDGSRLAAGDETGAIRLIDPETRESERLDDLGGKVLRIAFSPDGSRLAAGGRSGLALWDVAGTAAARIDLPSPTGEVWGLAFDPTGRWLATAGQGSERTFSPQSDWWAAETEPGAIMVWSAATGERLWRSDRGHERGIATSVDFSPDGTSLVSGGEGGDVLLWEWDPEGRRGELRARLETRQKSVWSVAFDPGGALVAASSENDGRLVLWHRRLERVVADYRVGAPGSVWTIAFRPAGRTLAMSLEAGGGRVALLDVGGEPPSVRPSGDRSDELAATSLALRPDGGLVAAAGPSETVHLLRPVVASPLSRPATVWSATDQAARAPADQPLWRARSVLEPHGTVSVASNRRVCALAFGADGLFAAVATPSPDSGTGAIEPAGAATSVRPCPSALFDAPSVAFWDASSSAPRELQLGLDKPPDALASDPPRRRLAVGTWESDVEIFTLDPRPQKSLSLRVEGKRWARSLAFSREGDLLAVGDRFGDVTVWNLEDLSASRLSGQAFEVPCLALAFSAGGELLAAGYEDGRIGVWDLASREPIGTFPSQGDATVAGVAGPPGARPASDRAVRSLAFADDGRALISGDTAGTFTQWDLDPEVWRRRACRRAARNLSCKERELYLRGTDHPVACPENDVERCPRS